MLKADKLRFEKLRSTDEAVRVAAATELEEKRRQYFFEHMIDLPCNSIHHAEWVRSYRETTSEVAKAWIARALVQSHAQGQDVAEVLVDTLRHDQRYLRQLILYAGYMVHMVPGGKERMKALHDHPDPNIRWQVSDSLHGMARVHGLDYATDAPVLRKLIVDREANMNAVLAMATFGKLEAADREALQEAIRIDGESAAAHYARELLAKHP
jgi:hypothetical protein